MPNITWNDTYSVGMQEIDDQHKKLFTILNSRFDQMRNVNTIDTLETVLRELNDYASYHFATEEKYFLEYHYGKTEEHILQHNAFRESIQKFSERYRTENKQNVAFEIMDFLVDWWLHHVTGADQEYKQCFTSHGLK
jgi:hemerythrin